ncbi:MAG: hypothetical protein LUG51_14185 [Tannerellaceae bacterium]|nr:hypothetical protein [Tannerellaceae bacterium]
MKKEELIYIEKLIDRFFEGETTNQEEEQLYRFFSQQEIPAHLESYRKVFHYLETDLKTEIHEKEGTVSKLNRKEPVEKWLVTLTAVAAVILLLIVGKTYFTGAEDFDPYEGSYIVENGIRITDPQRISEEIERSHLHVREVEKKISRLNRYEEKTLSYIDYVEDPYQCLMNQFEGEIAREEMKKIIGNK